MPSADVDAWPVSASRMFRYVRAASTRNGWVLSKQPLEAFRLVDPDRDDVLLVDRRVEGQEQRMLGTRLAADQDAVVDGRLREDTRSLRTSPPSKLRRVDTSLRSRVPAASELTRGITEPHARPVAVCSGDVPQEVCMTEGFATGSRVAMTLNAWTGVRKPLRLSSPMDSTSTSSSTSAWRRWVIRI
jgi:hypothetical protein